MGAVAINPAWGCNLLLRRPAFGGLVLLLALLPASLAAQGFPPEEAARRMTVPAGFKVELVASEPMVRQPVAIEFDDRGRLWVIQYLQYPNPAGLERVKVDRYSRTVYDRVPEPPPRGPRGADRLTILLDTDGDGRADEARDFIEGLNLASGLAFGGGGVFVLQAPYLLFYPDRDRDDSPDSDPEMLLKGFGMEDAHSVANSLTWGPDGWLYGCQGSTVTANVRGIEFQQGVWRYHPRTKEFELFCEGGGNSWGLDFDRHGNLFYSTNVGGFSMLHGVQGGYYWKQFTKHGALHNPYAFGYFDHVPHRGFRGGHVTVGGIVYQGDSFPESFRGAYIAADLLGHAVYWHKIEPRGSTFQAEFAGELLLANDTWFAPSDVTLGPDGSVYVADWHDKRTAHPDPDAEWDRSNGRIYRIRFGASKPARVPDVRSLSSEELMQLLEHPNAWQARLARRVLAERRDPKAAPSLRGIVLGEKDPGRALRALWALGGSGGCDEALAGELLGHSNENVRSWTVRFLGDARRVSKSLGEKLIDLAASDSSAIVRAQLASTARRLPPEAGLAMVEAIVQRNLDASDPYIPLLLWWAVEGHALAAADRLLEMLAAPAVFGQPLARDTILPRLLRRYAAEETDVCFTACARLLNAARGTNDRQTMAVMVGALDESLEGRTFDAVPAPLQSWLAETWGGAEPDVPLLRLAARLGLDDAHQKILGLLTEPRTGANTRVELLGIVRQAGRPACVPRILELAGGAEPEPVQLAALQALQRFGDERIARKVLEDYPRMSLAWRARARSLLLGRKAWALAFLEGVDRGELSAEEIPVDELRRLAAHEDEAIDSLVRKHWGSITGGTPEEKLADVRRLNNDLRAGPGDPARGRLLFTKDCATCHSLHGEGNRIGPDLTHANRQDRDYLLVSTVDPSAVIRKEYMGYILRTRDGRVFTGLITEEGPGTVTLVAADGTRTAVARGEIEALAESPASLMPENLLKELKPEELRDLFSYLQSDKPQAAIAPHAKEKKPSTGS